MVVFSLLIHLVLTISLDAKQEMVQAIAPGILWIPVLFSAMLGFSRYGRAEHENGALTGLLVSPVDRGAIFAGKLLGILLLVLIVAAISVLSFFIFFKQPYPESTGLLIATVVLGTWGFVAVGIFLSTLAIWSNMGELLLPIMLFPLSVPLLIAVTQLTEMALYPSAVPPPLFLWVAVLVGYDLLFTVVPVLLIEPLLEVV